MKNYRYSARGLDGAWVSGEVQAASASQAAAGLLARALQPLSLHQATPPWLARLGQLSPPSAAELVMFYRQMHSLLNAGVPLQKALSSIRSVTRLAPLRQALDGVLESLNAGQPLAVAMRQQQPLFSPLAISLAHAGEESGALAAAFAQIAAHLEREQTTRRRVWSEVRYPMFVLALLIAALTIVNTVAVPVFVGLFQRLGTPLPLATQVLMAVSGFTTRYGPLLLALFIAAVVLGKAALRTPSGSRVWHGWQLRLPLVGAVLRMCMMARFCGAFGLMMAARLPLLQALAVAAEASNNLVLRQALLEVRSQVARGHSLTDTLRGSSLFTPLVEQMLAVGEASGAMAPLMESASRYYEDEAEYQARHLTQTLQPILLGIMALAVGLIAAGIFLPMWSMADGFQH